MTITKVETTTIEEVHRQSRGTDVPIAAGAEVEVAHHLTVREAAIECQSLEA